MIKFNYILNDLALSNLITRCLYSESADYSDKQELENQIKLIQKENKQLIANWNKLKEYMTNAEQIYKESDDEYVKDIREMGIRHAYRIILFKMQELEQGSDE